MVGRSARGEQPGHGVDDRAFVDDLRQGALAALGKLGEAMHRRPGQCLPQRSPRVDERRIGDVQPHQFHHHLVAIGGAVEGAGPGRVVGARFGHQQLVLADLALGKELADPLLFLVRQARGHRPARHQKHRQMAEAERSDQQAGNDLVTDAEQGRGVEHAVAKRDRGAKRDHIAAEQRQVHARLALGHSVAHRRDSARDLRRRPHFAREDLHLLGVAAVGLMRRKHVVVSGDDADVGPGHRADRGLVLARRGKAVREIAARQARAVDPPLLLFGHQLEVAPAGRLRPLDDPVGHPGNGRIETHQLVSTRAR